MIKLYFGRAVCFNDAKGHPCHSQGGAKIQFLAPPVSTKSFHLEIVWCDRYQVPFTPHLAVQTQWGGGAYSQVDSIATPPKQC